LFSVTTLHHRTTHHHTIHQLTRTAPLLDCQC